MKRSPYSLNTMAIVHFLILAALTSIFVCGCGQREPTGLRPLPTGIKSGESGSVPVSMHKQAPRTITVLPGGAEEAGAADMALADALAHFAMAEIDMIHGDVDLAAEAFIRAYEASPDPMLHQKALDALLLIQKDRVVPSSDSPRFHAVPTGRAAAE